MPRKKKTSTLAYAGKDEYMVKALEKLSKSLPKAYQCKKSLREEKGRKGYVIHGKNP